jgi:enoyl-CoA hydratase/carnithine racemase
VQNVANIKLIHHGSVAVVTLDRPHRRNALTSQVRSRLTELFTDFAGDERVTAVVLASTEQAFSAGQDLNEAKDYRPEEIVRWIGEHMDLYRAVLTCPKPVLAAIEGCCIGAGFQLALLSDLRIAGRSAFFAMPELDDAIPCILGVWTLYDVIGRGRTTEMVLTNRLVQAEEARDWGLVAEVCDHPTARAMELAELLASKPALALRMTKERLAVLALADAESLTTHAQLAHMRAFASGQPAQAMAEFLSNGRRR